jgi:hypothetical protein
MPFGMIAMSHIILHLGLCGAVLKRPPDTSVAIHVRVVDHGNSTHVNQTFQIVRDYAPTTTVAFDVYQGEYAMEISAPQYNCNAVDFIHVLPEHDRTISEQLVDGPPQLPQPMLLSGTAPQSFLYLQPTYVLFDKSQQCSQPVGDPIPVHLVVENDEDSFYVWLYPDASLFARGSEILAMQLQTPTGEDHYIRLKIPFPMPWRGWPADITFNVRESDADYLATQPTGVLLCPKLFETSSG